MMAVWSLYGISKLERLFKNLGLLTVKAIKLLQEYLIQLKGDLLQQAVTAVLRSGTFRMVNV